MASFVCPVCGSKLKAENNIYRCDQGHCYDISRSGYVNLLQSQKSQNHGDDKLMVRARKEFLEKGYYNQLRDAIAEQTVKYLKNGDTLIDAGCGECFYTSFVAQQIERSGLNAEILAVDISKNALSYAGKRNSSIKKAVASIFHMPVSDSSCDVLLNIFAPYCESEFLRILKKGGIYIRVIPLEDHLWSLKKAVYDRPYKNQTEEYQLSGFDFVTCRELRYKVDLQGNADIKNLFMMTPYYYKTSENDFKKLDVLESLTTEVEFAVIVYRKV